MQKTAPEYKVIIMKKVAFHTLGCKVNQYETEALKERFEAGGYTVVPEEETADVYVINTCTVTNLADRKSRQFIRRAIKKNPDAIVAACGCYVQINPEEAASIPGVDLVVGTNGKQELFDKVEELMEKRSETALRMVLPYSELTEYRSDGIISAMDGRSRAFIKIQEGCDRFCSYCLIPFARGRVRSRDADEILEEVRALVGKGFREIVLTGINTALYGRDDLEDGGKGFARLLDRIDAVPGDFRVRLSSLEPTVVSPSQVADVLDHERLCHHLHLSIQSGSDPVLKAMNRGYTRAEYLEIVDMIRKRDPHFGITTDIICGFPGETDQDVEDTLALIKEAAFARVHVFGYSRRDGTKAAAMPGQIPAAVKAARVKLVSDAAELAARDFIESCRGLEQIVLPERLTDDGGFYEGYSGNYLMTYIPAERFDEDPCGSFVKAKLDGPFMDGVRGIC